MGMTESKKRDFVEQMIVIIGNNQDKLINAGFDPTAKQDELVQKSDTAKAAEVKQQQTKAALKAATSKSVETLSEAYKLASNLADLVSGLYGKDDEIVQEIRKMRK